MLGIFRGSVDFELSICTLLCLHCSSLTLFLFFCKRRGIMLGIGRISVGFELSICTLFCLHCSSLTIFLSFVKGG